MIPAAGLGSRFFNAGFSQPKPLIEVGGLKLIEWVIGNFDFLSGDKIFLIVRENIDRRDLYLNLSIPQGIDLEIISLSRLTDGAASTVLEVIPYLNHKLPLVVANSDQYVSNGLDSYISEVRRIDNGCHILTMEASDKKWSYVRKDRNSKLVSAVVEKKVISNEATVGIYSWSTPNLFEQSVNKMKLNRDRTNGEYYVAPSYNYLIEQGIRVTTFNCGRLNKEVHGLGTPEDLEIFSKWSELNMHSKGIKKKFTGKL